VMPSGARYSSAMISPGWIGAIDAAVLISFLPSVVVGDLDVFGSCGTPAKADAPLLVHP
jgi:hypothetical protein